MHRCDAPALVPMGEEVGRRARARPQTVLADAGFYSNVNVCLLPQRGMDVYLPGPESGARIAHQKAGPDDWTKSGARCGTEGNA